MCVCICVLSGMNDRHICYIDSRWKCVLSTNILKFIMFRPAHDVCKQKAMNLTFNFSATFFFHRFQKKKLSMITNNQRSTISIHIFHISMERIIFVFRWHMGFNEHKCRNYSHSFGIWFMLFACPLTFRNAIRPMAYRLNGMKSHANGMNNKTDAATFLSAIFWWG